MSDLSALQPSIFFATCTLKGIVWIPWYFLPELYLTRDELEDDEDPLLKDHHALLMERVCHYTNIFALIGIISFYAVNPRLWQYRSYGWFLTALLIFQHIPQQILHEGFFRDEAPIATEDDDDAVAATAKTTTALDILQTNRIFSTIGVLLFLTYTLYQGPIQTLLRLAAEPFFVYTTLITLLLETHVTCLTVWWIPNTYHHVSHAVGLFFRQVLCGLLAVGLVALMRFHRQAHKQQAKLLRRQLKAIHSTDTDENSISSTKPKMKFV
jgi:hypothetical protein